MMSYVLAPEFGSLVLLIALALGMGILLLSVLHWRRADSVLPIVQGVLKLQFGVVVLAFLLLIHAFARSDFSFATVWQNSSLLKPIFFKIAATWGNHEGSMLLWATILAGYGVYSVRQFRANIRLSSLVNIALYSSINMLFLSYLFFVSNPFLRVFPTPKQGQDLNPVLQDIALVVHPPLLYMGTVSTAAVFCLACVWGLFPTQLHAVLPAMQRVARIGWSFLTVGIALGAYWAYYELGWGGWWFWDPVENASFLPWLLLLGFLHGAHITVKREAFHYGTFVMAVLPFVSVVLGFFLVRSGILNSVHAFAVDPERGVWLLAIFAISLVALFGVVVAAIFPNRQYEWRIASRDGILRMQILFMVTTFATVLAGVIYPIILEALTEHKISVGQPFFESVLFPLSAVMFALMVAVPFVGWAGVSRTRNMMWNLAAIAAIFTALNYENLRTYDAIYGIFYALGFAIIAAALCEGSGFGVLQLGRFLWPRSFSIWATRCAHAGVGVAIIGAVMASQGKIEASQALARGEHLQLGAYRLTLETLEQVTTENYTALVAHIGVYADGQPKREVETERRIYTLRQSTTTEVGLLTQGFSQHYIALGEVVDGKRIVVRAQYKPFILLIWLGAGLMALGGILATFGRTRQKNLSH